MPYLDQYTTVLTTKTAAQLLRRATFGPTQSEITNFTGLTATQAVQQLISNANYSPPPPVDLDSTKATAGQTYLDKPFNGDRNFDFGHYLHYCYMINSVSWGLDSLNRCESIRTDLGYAISQRCRQRYLY